jgi:hypothetical protein
MTLGNMREHGVLKEWIGSFRFFEAVARNGQR